MDGGIEESDDDRMSGRPLAARAGDEGLAVRRSRLYQPGATVEDVAAYQVLRDRAIREAALDPVGGPARDLPRPRGRVMGAIVVAGLICIAVAITAGIESGGTVPVPERTVSRGLPVVTRPLPLLSRSDAATVSAVLRERPSEVLRGERLGQVVEAVLPVITAAGAPHVVVVRGTGAGPTRVPLGTVGSIASGRRLRVAVVALEGEYSWILRAQGADGPIDVARATSVGSADATSATVAVPRSARDCELLIRVDADRPFLYFLSVND
ncbi:hypothetical protein [uncultured Amnibacterium sp.]|uniref:hypothetical protein n=1 Tax=uncultured Amnibacterium sp. TaxID=1631851 RepID=UPI0035CB0D35